MATIDGTQIGVDGKRHPIDSLPPSVEEHRRRNRRTGGSRGQSFVDTSRDATEAAAADHPDEQPSDLTGHPSLDARSPSSSALQAAASGLQIEGVEADPEPDGEPVRRIGGDQGAGFLAAPEPQAPETPEATDVTEPDQAKADEPAKSSAKKASTAKKATAKKTAAAKRS